MEDINEKLAHQEATIEKLTKALTEINQMSDSGSYAQSMIRMKNIASKALTGRKMFTHHSHVDKMLKKSIPDIDTRIYPACLSSGKCESICSSCYES